MSYSRAKLADEILTRMKTEDEKKLARKTAAYLIAAGKTSELNSLTRDMMQLQKSEEKIVELDAVSAHPLSTEQIKNIEKAVKAISPNAEEIIINRKIDQGVIGGVRLEFANHLLDLSAGAKLNKLKQLTG